MKYVLSLLFLLCGCSPINTYLAKQYVSVFHELYQNGRYSDIYKGASPDLQKATSEEKFISIMVDAKEKHLGLFKKTTIKFERSTHSLLSNNEISLVCYSEYSKRIVQEVFIFEIENGEVKLKSYRYDSIN